MENSEKYADGDVYPSDFDINFTKTGMMYDSEFGEIVDLWLEEDSKLRRKERRTNKKIFNQLKTEYNFKGSYRTVCEYIQLRKPQMKIEKSTRYERLEHPAGEAQVDFGNMTVVKDGAYKDIKALLLSFLTVMQHLYTHYHLKIRNAFRRLETIISSSWWCTNPSSN